MARAGISSDTTNFIIKIVFVILAIVILYILIRRHPGFINWVKGLTGGSFVGAAVGEFADANPPHQCTNVVEGELEQEGDRKEPRIEGCGFNFLNQEVIAYINYHGINDTFSVKLRGPRHSGDGPCVCNNIHYFNLGSTSKAAFGKQAEHTEEYCEFGDQGPTLPENVWVGVKCVEWNEGSGVHFQSYVENPEGSGWKLVADAVDNGNAGDCSGPASPPFTTSPCVDPSCPEVSTDFRVDGIKAGGGDVEFKNLSVREIIPPTGDGGTTTTPTPPDDEEETPPPEDDEEEEEDGDGDEDGEDNIDSPQCDEDENQCTCADGTSFPLTASQTCDDCTEACESDSGAARARRDRNSSRRAMYTLMLRSFSSRKFRYMNKLSPRNYGHGFTANRRNLRLGNL